MNLDIGWKKSAVVNFKQHHLKGFFGNKLIFDPTLEPRIFLRTWSLAETLDRIYET